jgi:hypothetical protein
METSEGGWRQYWLQRSSASRESAILDRRASHLGGGGIASINWFKR